MPGRKTDVKDSQWIAELIRCGLIRKSFVPPKWQRALRDLTRYRRKLVEAQASERNRLQRLLETCNVKLALSPGATSCAPSSRARRRPKKWPGSRAVAFE